VGHTLATLQLQSRERKWGTGAYIDRSRLIGGCCAGHGWLGCSHEYVFPEELNGDYGEPTEICKETAPNSGVFTREWTKASVQMDCKTYTPTITMK
jgi:hypothetical protein